ncbi:MAG TPA: purine-nucleoside phosphorylase [Pirellulales bacterium]|nr:purine-nucleoside phosphorylase [Pirellulales bacterium]
MLKLAGQIDEAVAGIRRQYQRRPRVAIILGSGLGGLADEIDPAIAFAYSDLPHFPRSTAIGHRGRLVCGRLADVEVVAMQGRFHSYEGYSQQQITFPVRVMKALGAETLIVTNAAGGVNPHYRAGDLMVIDDQINLMFDNPLIGVNDDRLGPRFPDMSQPYCAQLQQTALAAARKHGIVAHRGVYLAVKGPNYEPRAEYRFYRQIGADAVGMSTVPEVIVAAHASMRVLGISVISNACSPEALSETSGEQVVQVAAVAGVKLRKIVLDVLPTLAV